MKRLMVVAILGLALTGCGRQQPSGGVATVNISRVTSNWPKFINYQNQLAADNDAIVRSSASPRDKQRQLDRLRQRYVNMQVEITGDVRTAAEQIANERHYRFVVTREFVGYGGIDITPDVEKILKITEKSPPPNQ